MNCKNCKNWVFGRCTVSNLLVGPYVLCNAWELSQSHEMVTMPFATFDDKELQERIAELEAEVLELKPYRDGYDATKVFPPEGQWVWLRDCDDNIEPVQYDHKAGFYWNYSTNTDGEPFCYWENNNVDIRRWYPMPDLPEEVQK